MGRSEVPRSFQKYVMLAPRIPYQVREPTKLPNELKPSSELHGRHQLGCANALMQGLENGTITHAFFLPYPVSTIASVAKNCWE